MIPGRPRVIGPDGPVVLPERPGARVCIVLLSGIGDVVHGLALANDLRRVRPDVEITWIAEPVPAQVLERHPAVDRLVVYDKAAGLTGMRRLRRALRGYRADVTLNVQRYLKSVWPTLLSRAPVRVGLARSRTRDAIWLAHSHVLADGPWRHTQDLVLDFRWALGVPRDAPVEWRLGPTETERAAAAAFGGAPAGGVRIGLVPASANPKKDWPAARWVELARRLASDPAVEVVLLGGPSRRERALADRVTASGVPVRDALGDGVRGLIALIDSCDVVVSPDTGPLHIAHALDVPVVGLFGHTNPWRVGPYRRFHDLVVDRYTDAGSEADPSAYLPKMGRMEEISVDDVVEKVGLARARVR